MIFVVGGVGGVVIVIFFVVLFVLFVKVKVVGVLVEVDISGLKFGEMVIVLWCGKLVWILNCIDLMLVDVVKVDKEVVDLVMKFLYLMLLFVYCVNEYWLWVDCKNIFVVMVVCMYFGCMFS